MRYKAPRSWLDGQPAAVARKVGDGSISYIGAWLDDPAAKRAAHWMLAESGVQPDLIAVPNGVEVYRRAAKDRDVFIIENDSLQEQTVDLPATMKDLLNGGDIRSVTLPVYGVAVLEKSRPAQ